MRITLKHYYYFGPVREKVGHTLDSDSWDSLRVLTDDPHFSIPDSRDSFGLTAEKVYNQDIVQQIVLLIKARKYKRVISFGVGRAFLEYNIKRVLPEVHLSCLDYSPKAIERLKQVFPECDEIGCFDMRTDIYIKYSEPDTLFLFYRISTEFSNDEWERIFGRLYDDNILSVLFVPTEVANTWDIIKNLLRRTLYQLQNKDVTFAGYIRNRESLEQLYSPKYKVKLESELGNLRGFLLERQQVK